MFNKEAEAKSVESKRAQQHNMELMKKSERRNGTDVLKALVTYLNAWLGAQREQKGEESTAIQHGVLCF